MDNISANKINVLICEYKTGHVCVAAKRKDNRRLARDYQ
jgi:hypothetical protein